MITHDRKESSNTSAVTQMDADRAHQPEKDLAVALRSQIAPMIKAVTPQEWARLKFHWQRQKTIQDQLEAAAAQLISGGADAQQVEAAQQEVLLQLAEVPRSENGYIVVDESFEYPAYNFLVKDWGLCAGPPAILCAYGDSGKTLLAQHIAICVATSTPLFGQYSVAGGPVVHLDFEQGRVESHMRYARIARGQGLQLRDGYIFYSRPRFKLDDLDAEDRLLELMTDRKLIIIDSLRAGITGDENDSSSRSSIDLVGEVSERTGCAAILLAHAGKSKAEGKHKARGTSAFFDAVSVFFELEKEDGKFLLRNSKERITSYKGMTYTIEDVGDVVPSINKSAGLRFKFIEQLSKAKEPGVREKILSALAKGPLSATDLWKAVGGNEQHYGNTKNALLAEGAIERNQEGRKQMFSLTEKGEAEWRIED